MRADAEGFCKVQAMCDNDCRVEMSYTRLGYQVTLWPNKSKVKFHVHFEDASLAGAVGKAYAWFHWEDV